MPARSTFVALTTNSDPHDWNGVFISGNTSDYAGQTVYGLLLLAFKIRGAMFHLTFPSARDRIRMVKEIGHAIRSFCRTFS